MKATVIIALCLCGVVVATKDIHKREKRQARWGSQGGSNGVPTPTWTPTTMGTQSNFGSQNWGSTQPSVGFPSMFNDIPRSRNSLQAPPTSGTSRGSKPSAKKQSSKSNKSGGSPKKSPTAQGGPPPGRGPPTRPAPTQPLPTYPPTIPPQSMRRSKTRRNRPRPQGRSMTPTSNLNMASMIPPSFLQGLGRAMADKLRTMWLNPLYQQQAKAAGDNFVVNPNPVNVGYHSCPPTIISHRCVYNPCPRCRNQAIECWTNPCGGCTGEMYLRGTRIHDCETI
ncbi:nascent polypeptide-associated complex subunit alpha, muscle-specific form-like isoform X1 [Argopecten irradians]|uniref:nascent polypeptide-associated complex subunit alpha, muscle-specific form-like isoform X1 n=1 Tax=Argopecten irradians TaxID=31199 RepID=UPI00371EE650